MLERCGAREVERKGDKDKGEVLSDAHRRGRDPSNHGTSGFRHEGA